MLLKFGQRLLNEQIRASTAARQRAEGLEGRRFAVTVRDSDLRFVATVNGGQLELSYEPEADCDVELTAGTIDLLRLARTADLSALRESGATLNGDLHVAESFSELLRLAVPEPEGVLADWVGDIPAHAVGEIARGTLRFGQRAGEALVANTSEYLQEESPTLVPPALAREFIVEVERIRDDVERAERRIELLEHRHRHEADQA